MRKTLSIVSLFLCLSMNVSLHSQAFVDERTELLSIVFRLAGAEEYINNQATNYIQEVDRRFSPFKDHELIAYTREIREKNNIGFDAVMDLAINLELDEEIKLLEYISPEDIDSRWGDHLPEFLSLLNMFYRDSEFPAFFKEQKPFFKELENHFRPIEENLNLGWFKQFYGYSPSGSIKILLSVSNGRHCYGPRKKNADGGNDFYAIMGFSNTDKNGCPIYSSGISSFIIHEFCHSYCNPIIDRHIDQLEPKASMMYSLVSEKMKNQHYGSPNVMYKEMFVRASVIMYNKYKNTHTKKIDGMIIHEENNGFHWIRALIELLDKYVDTKDEYSNFEDFFPKIIKQHNGSGLNELLKDYESKCPEIISCNITNNARDIDPSISYICIKFDRKMEPFYYGTSDGKAGEEYYPPSPEGKNIWWNEKTYKEFYLPVALEPDTEYSISFPNVFFKDEKGYLLHETYYLDFKTK